MESDHLLELRSVSFVLKPNQTTPDRLQWPPFQSLDYMVPEAEEAWVSNQEDLVTVAKYPIHFQWLRT